MSVPAPPRRIPLAVRLWHGLAALLLAGTWGIIHAGLFSAGDAYEWGELEGGGRFGVAFFAYLPYYALTLIVAAVVLAALLPLPGRFSGGVMVALVATVVAVTLFVAWLSSMEELHAPQPLLPEALRRSVPVLAGAAGALAGGWVSSRRGAARSVTA